MQIRHEFDKPPVLINVEAEQQLLGSLLLDSGRMGKIGAMAAPELFGDPVHADMFAEILRRTKADEYVSPVAMRLWAEAHDGVKALGGAGYLVRLAGSSISSNEVGYYASLLDDLRARRAIHAAASQAIQDLGQYDEAPNVIAGRLEAALAGNAAASKDGPVSMLAAATIALRGINSAYHGEPTRAVPSGIMSLDKMIIGFNPGDFVILAGRPSMGKSAVALDIALNVAVTGGGVCFASLEMPSEAMAMRAISRATSIARDAVAYSSMRRGEMTERQFESVVNATREVSELPIHFLPSHYRDLGALYAGAKRVKSLLDGNLSLLVVDYLQLLQAPAKSRYEQITEISIALKSLAMQLDIPVLALSQLSRAVEQRDDKRPMMSDIRESGQLEQDADTIMFCYRDEYYLEREKPDGFADGEKFDAWQDAMNAARNKLEIIVSKQRMGPIGTANVQFNPSINRIWES